MSELKSESPSSPTPKVDNNQETSESPTSPPPTPADNPETPAPPPKSQLHNNSGLLSDIVLWRRKQVNAAILVVATATWIFMDVYQYSFITLISWVAIAVLACLFFWGSVHRFLKKEAPDLSELEMSEETAREQARLLRQRAEDGIRLMFHVGAEREWFVFVGVVASLYLVSLAAKYLAFVTLCFIGVVGAMMVPVIYVRNEKKIGEVAENVRMRSQRMNVMIEEKLQKLKNRIGGKHKEVKAKKAE